MNEHDRRLLGNIMAETTETLRSEVGHDVPVALLDFPDHQNVGDSLIWAGERAYLRALNNPVVYTSTLRSLDPRQLESRLPEGPILLHGGGNFGDLYPGFQVFRERVVDLFPRRRIVLLPQSIYFRSPERAREANAALRQHPDLTVLVRDADSMQRCAEFLPDLRVVFCHDTAAGVGPLRRRAADVDVLVLARVDQETAGALELDDSVQSATVDWGLTGSHRWAYAAAHVPSRVARRLGHRRTRWLSPLIDRCHDAVANINVAHGVRILSRGRTVVTDRLHAHVLCSLLGIPHLVVDNTYGKLGAVMAATTGGFSTVTRVPDRAELSAVLAAG